MYITFWSSSVPCPQKAEPRPQPTISQPIMTQYVLQPRYWPIKMLRGQRSESQVWHNEFLSWWFKFKLKSCKKGYSLLWERSIHYSDWLEMRNLKLQSSVWINDVKSAWGSHHKVMRDLIILVTSLWNGMDQRARGLEVFFFLLHFYQNLSVRKYALLAWTRPELRLILTAWWTQR